MAELVSKITCRNLELAAHQSFISDDTESKLMKEISSNFGDPFFDLEQ